MITVIHIKCSVYFLENNTEVFTVPKNRGIFRLMHIKYVISLRLISYSKRSHIIPMKNVYLFITLSIFALSILPEKSKAQCTCSDGAPADSVVHTFTLSPTSDFTSSISFPKFDPSIGTL